MKTQEEMERFYKYQWYHFKKQENLSEWDSIVVLKERRMIINIEVKSGFKLNALDKAAKQTKAHLGIFNKIFGALLSDDWKFVKAACTPRLNLEADNIGNDHPCEHCKQFIIDEKDLNDMVPWLEKINKLGSKTNLKSVDEEYENLLVGMIGSESLRNPGELNKLINDPYDFSKETVFKLTESTSGVQGESKEDTSIVKSNKNPANICYMLTPEQLEALNVTSGFLIIEGEFGTGKTYVLKERAKDKAKKYPNCRIAYINLSSLHNATLHGLHNGSFSVMDILAIKDFEQFSNIEVVTVNTLYDHMDQDKAQNRNEITIHEPKKSPWIELSSVLNSFLKHNVYDHIFIDELPALTDLTEDKFNFHNVLEKGTTVCMTLKAQEFHENIWDMIDPLKLTEDFKQEMRIDYNADIIQLKCNMRNSDNIVNMASAMNNPMKSNIDVKCHRPEKNIIGPVCYYAASNYGKETELDRARAVIHKYFQDRFNEPVVFLISDTSTGGTEIYDALHETFSRDRKVVYLPTGRFKWDPKHISKHVKDVTSFLENPQGILVSRIEAFFGAQARSVVVFTRDYDNFILNSLYRSMSFAIIVGGSIEFTGGPVVIKDDDLITYANSEGCIQCERIISSRNMANHIEKWHT